MYDKKFKCIYFSEILSFYLLIFEMLNLTLIWIYLLSAGVLWRTNSLIRDADTALNKLRKMGKKIFYVTNNSTKTRETLVSKCVKLGFIANKVCCFWFKFFYIPGAAKVIPLLVQWKLISKKKGIAFSTPCIYVKMFMILCLFTVITSYSVWILS